MSDAELSFIHGIIRFAKQVFEPVALCLLLLIVIRCGRCGRSK